MAGVYDSLARGIESGFNMGLRADAAAEEKRARGVQEKRQATADARAAEESGIQRRRQAETDARTATEKAMGLLTQRKGELENLSVAARTANQPVDPTVAAEYADVDQRLSSMRQEALDYWSRTQSGREDPAKTPDGTLYRNVAVAIGRRPEELPEVAQSIQDMQDAIASGNTGLAVQSANVLMAPQLRRGVGTPSPYGGKIIRKEIIGLDPARGGDGRDHPDMVIPRLRVYVQMDDGEGKQLYYDAPMSKGGGTDDAPVAVSMKNAMDWMGNLGVLATALQKPEFKVKLEQGSKEAGAEVQMYLERLTQIGDAKKPKPTLVNTPAGGTTTMVSPDGTTRVVAEGAAKPEPAPVTREVVYGTQKRTEQWDPATKTWKPLGEMGPRFNPRTGSGGGGGGGGGGSGAGGGAMEPSIPDRVLTQMAERLLAGDKSVKVNLGRGAQGAANLLAIETRATDLGLSRGMSGRDIALAVAEFGGLNAAQRSLGTRAANFGLAKSEAYEMADLVTESSAASSRTQFMPINKALNAFQKNTGDVEIRQFGAALNSFINAYARAVSPVGVPTVSDKEHAREMLSTADSHEQVVGIIAQLKKEMDAAGNAPGVVRRELRDSFNSAPSAPPRAGGAASGGTPPVDRLKEGQVTTFANGQKWTLKNGQPAKVE
jgi:hypothetical protein